MLIFHIFQDKAKVYLQLLDLEIQQIPDNEPIIMDLFQKGIGASSNVDNKMKFSQRRLTYLMDFGTDVAKWVTMTQSVFVTAESHSQIPSRCLH